MRQKSIVTSANTPAKNFEKILKSSAALHDEQVNTACQALQAEGNTIHDIRCIKESTSPDQSYWVSVIYFKPRRPTRTTKKS